MNRFLSLCLCFFALSLTGCIGQEIADEKMAKGCVAGINSLINPKKISNVENMTFQNVQESDVAHRAVNITAIEKDGWLEEEKQYKCLFLEQWGPFQTTHTALLIQVHINDEIYGKVDGEVRGDVRDFIALTSTVDQVMGQ